MFPQKNETGNKYVGISVLYLSFFAVYIYIYYTIPAFLLSFMFFAKVDFEDTNLCLAARSVQMAIRVIQRVIPASSLKRCLLAEANAMSSSCSGVYTAEVALALIQQLTSFGNWFAIDGFQKQ